MQIDKDTYFCAFHENLNRGLSTEGLLCACGLPKEVEITKINYDWGFWDTPPEPKQE